MVAPPISSGTSKPSRSISAATWHISSSDGVIRPGKTDDVGLLLDRDLEDFFRGHHHAKIDHFVIVALEHDADDVLADIVHVALDGGEHDLAVRRRVRAAVFLLLHVGHEEGHGLLHHPCRFHDLRQEHLSRAKQVADGVHAVHQRAFDHSEWARCVAARFLHVDLDEVGDAMDQRMRQPFLDRHFAPRQIGCFLLLAVAAMALGERKEPLRRIVAAVKHDIFAGLAQLGIEIVVQRHLAGVDNTHVHAGLDRVIEKHRVHCLAHRLIASE